MPVWSRFVRRSEYHTTASELYGQLVALSRTPEFYSQLGVPDTPEGRAEMVIAHVAVVLNRLGQEGEKSSLFARSLAEVFVTDMDDCMREMGVADMSVARKVKKAAAALYDRTRDYGNALENNDTSELSKLIGAHILETPSQSDEPESHASNVIARYVMGLHKALSGLSAEQVLTGRIELPALNKVDDETIE